MIDPPITVIVDAIALLSTRFGSAAGGPCPGFAALLSLAYAEIIFTLATAKQIKTGLSTNAAAAVRHTLASHLGLVDGQVFAMITLGTGGISAVETAGLLLTICDATIPAGGVALYVVNTVLTERLAIKQAQANRFFATARIDNQATGPTLGATSLTTHAAKITTHVGDAVATLAFVVAAAQLGKTF